jgi:hypothetical protein
MKRMKLAWILFYFIILAVSLNKNHYSYEPIEKDDTQFMKALYCTCFEHRNVLCFQYTNFILIDPFIWVWNFLTPVFSLPLLLVIELALIFAVFVWNILQLVKLLMIAFIIHPILWFITTGIPVS